MTADQEIGLLYVLFQKHHFEPFPHNHYSRLMKQTQTYHFIIKTEHQMQYYL